MMAPELRARWRPPRSPTPHPGTGLLPGGGRGFCSAASWRRRQSLLPDLVERDEVLAAGVALVGAFQSGPDIGPMLAALALAVGSPGLCFRVERRVLHLVVVISPSCAARCGPSPRRRCASGARAVAGARRRGGQGVALSDPRHRTVGVIAEPVHRPRPGHGDRGAARRPDRHGLLVGAQGVGAVTGARDVAGTPPTDLTRVVLRAFARDIGRRRGALRALAELTCAALALACWGAYWHADRTQHVRCRSTRLGRERARIRRSNTPLALALVSAWHLVQSAFAKDLGSAPGDHRRRPVFVAVVLLASRGRVRSSGVRWVRSPPKRRS